MSRLTPFRPTRLNDRILHLLTGLPPIWEGPSPMWLRRLVVLLLPVSVPVLFVAFFLTIPMLLVEVVVLGVVGWAKAMWRR